MKHQITANCQITAKSLPWQLLPNCQPPMYMAVEVAANQMTALPTSNQDQTEDCQCDLCAEERDLEAVTIAVLLLLAEDKTDDVIPIPDKTNAATSQPEAEAGDVGTSEGCDVPTQSVVVSITESLNPGKKWGTPLF